MKILFSIIAFSFGVWGYLLYVYNSQQTTAVTPMKSSVIMKKSLPARVLGVNRTVSSFSITNFSFKEDEVGKDLKSIFTTPDDYTDEARSAEFDRSVATLKSRPKVAAAQIQEFYTILPEEFYQDRSLCVYLMRELKSEHAIPFLKKVLESELPEEKSKDTHHFSTQEKEVIIKSLALQGLTEAALTNVQVENFDHNETMLKLIESKPNNLLMNQAIRSFLSVESHAGNYDEAVVILKKTVPSEYHDMINLKEVTYEEKMLHDSEEIKIASSTEIQSHDDTIESPAP
jgi:hypothetical protein